MSPAKPKLVFLMSGFGVYSRGAEQFFDELRRRLAGEFDVVILSRARDVECVVLARAVRWHVQRRVLMNGHKSVVFQ